MKKSVFAVIAAAGALTSACGPTKLQVFARTRRCEATNVDPVTGARDMAIPAHLMRTWEHQDLGIYAKVTEGGSLAVGATVTPPL